MERFGTRPKNKNFGNRTCRFCNAPNWTPMHNCPALDANCNKSGKKRHYAKVCRQKTKNNPTVKRLTENELNEQDEPSSESEDSIHHIKKIKKIDETNKHFTTALKINGVMKEFIIDTGSSISLSQLIKLTKSVSSLVFKKRKKSHFYSLRFSTKSAD